MIASTMRASRFFTPTVLWLAVLAVLFVPTVRCADPDPDSDSDSDGGKCVMFESCGPTVGFLSARPRCTYNGPPRLLNDTDGLATLAKACPHMFRDEESLSSPRRLCCDSEVISSMSSSMMILGAMMSRCPLCYHNIKMYICEMTCSPRQADFLQVTRTEQEPNQNGTGKEYVKELLFSLDRRFTDSMYESCSLVTFGTELAINTFCGEWGGFRCTGVRLLDSLGENPMSPIIIRHDHVDLSTYSGDQRPLQLDAAPCNQPLVTTMGNLSSCSCSDCRASCPVAPPIPAPEGVWMVGPLYGTALLMIVFFLALATPLTVVMLCGSCRRRTYPVVSDSSDPHKLGGSDSTSLQDIPRLERVGASMQAAVTLFFHNWGLACARRPVLVLLVGVLVAGFCSCGIFWLEVTTDPVELWASPSSRSRVEKRYFDDHFEPFYRIEMLIIRAKNLQSFNHSTRGGDVLYGPVYHKDFLLNVLELQNSITRNLSARVGNETVHLSDICFKPLAPENQHCAIQSVLEYLQDDPQALDKIVPDGSSRFNITYLDHISYCLKTPLQAINLAFRRPCLGLWGGPVFPYTAVGGFLADGQALGGDLHYLNSTALVLTFLVNNHQDQALQDKVLAWEKAFLERVSEFEHPNMEIGFMAERSISDEIARVSESDTLVVMISYLLMFIYIAISLGQYTTLKHLPVDCKITLALGGVLIVLLSVTASLGIYGFIGVRGTLIVIEVIPFLILAVGADNIFFLVQAYQRISLEQDDKGEDRQERLEERIAVVVGEVAPSMLISSITDALCFFLGALTTMPAVKAFALFAGLALLFDFSLQITCFVALMTLDARREKSVRMDVLCCVRGSTEKASPSPGLLVRLFRQRYTPALYRPTVRYGVLLVFLAWFCSSLAVLPHLQVGLEAELSLPEDSHVIKYFQYQKRYLSVGPPVYFVVRGDLNYSDNRVVNRICSSKNCDSNSIGTQIYLASQQPARTYIASAASNWLDDFLDWSASGTCCYTFSNNATQCLSSTHEMAEYGVCDRCNIEEDRVTDRPDASSFRRYLPFFLRENPRVACPKGGHAAYGSAVNFDERGDVRASHFMSYHTILKTSTEFSEALRWARSLADNMTTALRQVAPNQHVQVFPYSVFYVFYEQYLTLWNDLAQSMAISMFVIFSITFLLLGLDLVASSLVVAVIAVILVNMAGLMYWWNIPLNAVSLVNLVMAVGISVEFCSHLVRSFTLSTLPTRVQRSQYALDNMGASILSGITLTKFSGILVLGFANSQIFRIFYFRMYLGIVLFGACHGLILLPVLLTYIGPPINRAYLAAERKHEELTNGMNIPNYNKFISGTSDDPTTPA